MPNKIGLKAEIMSFRVFAILIVIADIYRKNLKIIINFKDLWYFVRINILNSKIFSTLKL